MSSRRQAGRDVAAQSLPERILDAAAALLPRYGLHKTTMEDIAREAGCARPTVYKHYPSREALLGSLLLREVGRYLEELDRIQRHPATAKSLEDAFIFTLTYMRDHPVARGLLAMHPEEILTLLRGAGGDVLGPIVDAVAQLVAQQMDEGALRRNDPRIVAEAFIRFVVSFVLVPRVAFDQGDEKAMRKLFREGLMKGLA
jgi:AcrR family transcriptional regulator